MTLLVWNLHFLISAVGLLLVACGALLVFLAPWYVRKTDRASRVQVDLERMQHLSEEDRKQQKVQTAVLQVKLWGIALLIPGAVLYLIGQMWMS